MSDSKPSRAEMSNNAKELFNDAENTLETICDHVAAGGSLVELCRTWRVRYPDIVKWLRNVPGYNKRYEQALTDRAEWAVERILMELNRLGQADIRDIFNDDQSIKPMSEWTPAAAAIVSSIETREYFEGYGKDKEHVGEVRKVKLWSKEKALELLGKNLSMFTDRIEHQGKVSLADLVLGSMEESNEQ